MKTGEPVSTKVRERSHIDILNNVWRFIGHIYDYEQMKLVNDSMIKTRQTRRITTL